MSFNKMMEIYTRVLLRYRWPVVIASVLICGFIGAGALQLRTTPDNRIFFGQTNPELKYFEALEATYSQNNDVLIAVAPASGDMFTAERLDLLGGGSGGIPEGPGSRSQRRPLAT